MFLSHIFKEYFICYFFLSHIYFSNDGELKLYSQPPIISKQSKKLFKYKSQNNMAHEEQPPAKRRKTNRPKLNTNNSSDNQKSQTPLPSNTLAFSVYKQPNDPLCAEFTPYFCGICRQVICVTLLKFNLFALCKNPNKM